MRWLKNLVLCLLGRKPAPVGHKSLLDAIEHGRASQARAVANTFERK